MLHVRLLGVGWVWFIGRNAAWWGGQSECLSEGCELAKSFSPGGPGWVLLVGSMARDMMRDEDDG